MAKTIGFDYVIEGKGRSSTAIIAEVVKQLSTWKIEALNFIALLKLWNLRREQRRQLQSLSDYVLKDIGISRVDAEQEASKPFWRS